MLVESQEESFQYLFQENVMRLIHIQDGKALEIKYSYQFEPRGPLLGEHAELTLTEFSQRKIRVDIQDNQPGIVWKNFTLNDKLCPLFATCAVSCAHPALCLALEKSCCCLPHSLSSSPHTSRMLSQLSVLMHCPVEGRQIFEKAKCWNKDYLTRLDYSSN